MRFGAVVTGALTGAVAMTSKFEAGMAEIQTLLGSEAGPAVDAMADELKQLSVQTGQTLGALTKARYDIISAGFNDGAKSAMVMEASVDVARGGLVDVATAADLMTSALNGMGIAAEDAGSVADDLFTIVKLGKTTMGELAQSMGQVFATAKVAKVSLDEVGAAMAVITAAGIDTREGAVALNQLLLALAAPSGEAAGALKELGITLENGLGPALAKLAEAGDEGLDKLSELIPNIRALKAAAAAGSDLDKFNEALAEMADNSGASSEAVEIMAGTLQEQLKQLRQEVQVLAVDIGTELMPVARAIVGALREMAAGFRELPEGLKQFAVASTAALGAVSLLAGGFGTLAVSITATSVALDKLMLSGAASKLKPLVTTLGSLARALTAVATGIASVGAAPVVAAGAAIGGLMYGNEPGKSDVDVDVNTGEVIPLPGTQARPQSVPDYLYELQTPQPAGPMPKQLEPEVSQAIVNYVETIGEETAAAFEAEQARLAELSKTMTAEEADLPRVTPDAYDQITQPNVAEPVDLGPQNILGQPQGPQGAEPIEDIGFNNVPTPAELGLSTDDIDETGQAVTTLAQDFENLGMAIGENVTNNTWALADAMGQAIVFGQDFGKSMVTALKSIVAQLVAAIIQFLLLKVVIKGILNMLGLGGIGSMFGFATGTTHVPMVPQYKAGPRDSVLAFATGTTHVPHAPLHAASGMMSVPWVGAGGGDVVPAMLRPGEMVLTPERADKLREAIYSPRANDAGRSLIRAFYNRKRGGGGVLVGLREQLTVTEAIDIDDLMARAVEGAGGV
jgi:TP901 family phage tail tape measure protein